MSGYVNIYSYGQFAFLLQVRVPQRATIEMRPWQPPNSRLVSWYAKDPCWNSVSSENYR